jgi:glycosyltransferase involved in cell wall biosynthesis
MKLGVVVPCFNEEAVLPETAARLQAMLEGLAARGSIEASSSIWFVDDGSRDDTWGVIESLARTDPRIRGIKLSRNQGHQRALLAGLLHAEGDALVSIDADLQDDVGAIARMVELHLEGHDVVYGVRRRREKDTFFKRFTAEGYYRLLNAFGVEVVFNHADYRLLSRRALEALSGFSEVNLFLRGIVPLLGFRTASVEYDRAERFAGESKYPLRKMLSFAWEGITSFSALPLRLISMLGVAVFIAAVLVTAWVLWTRFFTNTAVPGWASTVLPIVMLGGLQILAIGVVGQYVAKIYLETKRRPRFFIDRII